MCFPTIWRAAAQRAKRALSMNADDAADAAAPKEARRPDGPEPASSIEYRESHRGFSIRVFSNNDGSFSVHVEGGRGEDAAKIEKRLADVGVSIAQKFPSFERAMRSVELAKRAIGPFAVDRGD
ncbi:hypothetical protein YK56LOC_38410 [Caballeronia sp. HLA56]